MMAGWQRLRRGACARALADAPLTPCLESTMAKTADTRKDTKKKPAMTPKEKKKAKQEKKKSR